ncbi:MAG: amidohydrolase [Desulfobacterales bacterium]|jgi:5-methylthioadenosine/S-adenosylhomocysteine deaminase
MTYEIVVYNGTVVTVNDRFEVIENGLICTDADRIVRVEPLTDIKDLPEAKTVIDAGGGLILPGLVNAHTHSPMTLLRGLAEDLPLQEWLNDHIFPAEAAHMTAANVSIGTTLACAEMMLSGTTTCCDGYFLEEAVAESVAACGLRAVLGQGVIDFPAPGIPDPKENIAVAGRFTESWTGRDMRIRPSVFCHSPYTCSTETLKSAKKLAQKQGLLFQIHAAETRDEHDRIRAQHGTTPIGYLDRLGLIDAATLLVHAVWVDENDMAVVADRGAAVAHCPESNMKLGAGIAPLTGLLAAGIAVGLGTDGCASNNTLDLFQTMDITAKLHKVRDMQPTAADAQTVLTLATRGGARAIGMEDDIGSLEAGKKADLIVIDTRQPHLVPMYHPVSHVVYAAKGSDVTTVIVDGHLLVRDRQLLHLDLGEIMARVNTLARAVGAKVTLP